MTLGGGEYSSGTVFKLTPPSRGATAWTQTILHSFSNSNGDGRSPVGTLLQDDRGALYGTTNYGGSGCAVTSPGVGCGIVYKLTPPDRAQGPWIETVIHAFAGPDGALPAAGLIQGRDGSLYGTSEYGGTYGVGTVFRLTPLNRGGTVWAESVLHSFPNNTVDGGFLYASLLQDARGALYGTTQTGGNSTSCFGAGCGVIFKLTPPPRGQLTWTENVLYSFTNGDGAFSTSNLIMDRFGALYGTASSSGAGPSGPSQNCYLGCGVVFKLSPPVWGSGAWTESVLYAFTGVNGDGDAPFAGLIADASGALYSTTSSGGAYNRGTVFKLTPAGRGQTTWAESVLHSFGGNAYGGDGSNPYSSLVAGFDGTFFGTTLQGGGTAGCGNNIGCGTVFALHR